MLKRRLKSFNRQKWAFVLRRILARNDVAVKS
ncbi:hypothetical protein ABIE63_003336 [Limibacillus sp. MBR-115]